MTTCSKNIIRKAIVLIGGEGTLLIPLTKDRPAALLPIINEPLIIDTVRKLIAAGISDILIVGSRGAYSASCLEFISEAQKYLTNLSYVEDELPRGSAGAMVDLRERIGSAPFLVVNGNCWLGDLSISDLCDFHCEKEAILTIAVQRHLQVSREGIRCADNGVVEDIRRIHPSRRHHNLETVGVYVFDPRALDAIRPNSYCDIKEQLVPLLRKASQPIYAYEVRQFSYSLHSVKNYFDLQRMLLLKPTLNRAREGLTTIADGVWVGEDVTISSKSYLVGPIVIGPGSVIEDNTQIIGPTVIGKKCTIEKGAVVRESILWDGVNVEMNARMQYCIAVQSLRITSGETYQNTVIVDETEPEDASLMALDQSFHGITPINVSSRITQKRLRFLYAKRLMDIVVSAIGIICVLPILMAVALAIKISSPGPVLFKQRRCGRGGKDFAMLKFRTMIVGAERQQATLAAKKKVDGPMFKLENDPRITPVGAFLRRTSLDELPQLLNVLKGEMSLVGPRPLVMDEMTCSPSWRDTRLRVKPGMTGLWQVSGRSEGHFHDWIRYDVHYVMNQSMLLDLNILLKTIKVVLNRVGAY